MVDLLAIGQGLNALKATTDILKTMVGLRDSAKLLQKTVELNSQIAAAQSALLDVQKEQSALVKTIDDLEKEIVRFKDWNTQKQRYELQDLGSGALAYVMKQAVQGSEPLHCICTNCYENGKRSIMQNTYKGPTVYLNEWKCPDCKNAIQVPDSWPSPPTTRAGRRG